MRADDVIYRDEWLPNSYPSRDVNGKRLRVSRVGTTTMLTSEEDAQLSEIRMSKELFRRLEQSKHILTADNAASTFAALSRWYGGTYSGPKLHIVCLTRRCNLNCVYCHMNPVALGTSKPESDMSVETAERVIEFAMGSPADQLKFEFQGGEPFLNFEVMRTFVEKSKSQARGAGKQIDFSAVTNLMIANDAQLAYCMEEGISLSYTLNGPKHIHDATRVSRAGHGSFDIVMRRLAQVHERFPGLLSSSPLCVVDRASAPQLMDTVRFFIDQGFRALSVIRLKKLGLARQSTLELPMQEFLPLYFEIVDFMYEANKTASVPLAERFCRVALSKIFSPTDTGYVDWRNPCGDFGGAITYDFDGEILPSDEARSLRSRFGLGNVRDWDYDRLAREPLAVESMNLSLRDRDSVCRECPYNTFCGVAPVLEYAREGDATPRPHESDECLFTLALLDWIFTKLDEDPWPLFRMMPGADQTGRELLNIAPAAAL